MTLVKYCIDNDDDGHVYLVPVEKREEFNSWVKDMRDFWECCVEGDEEYDLPEGVVEYGSHPNTIEFYLAEDVDGNT